MARQFKSGVADSKDVRIIKRGSASINLKLSKGDWIPYAYGANLRGINVSGSSLQYAVFSYANLNNANFHKTEISQSRFISAKLSGANFSEVTALGVLFVSAEMSAIDFSESDLAGSNFAGGKLQNAKFVKANLIRANFNGADLSGANLQEAHLGAAVFHSTILSKTDFTKAKLGATIFADCDLYNCVGLEEVQHLGPSSIDTSTLLRTFKNGGCCFTPELQIFFMNTGLPKHVLDSTPQTLADIAYYSCFIAYGEPDKPFAERIRKDLVAKGISCWIYSMDSTPGERTWLEIMEKRREAERMIVLCSASSLVRDGVLKELEEQKDEDPVKILPISLDDTWKQSGFQVKRGLTDLKPFLLERNYADFRDPRKYNNALCRLLKGLKKKS